MKSKQSNRGTITVLFDGEADAAYVRFAEGKIARTVVKEDKEFIATFDVDSQGNLLGAEIIGARDFTFRTLMAKLSRMQHKIKLKRHNPAKLQEA